MGSVVIIFLPILVPVILFLGIAEKFGYTANDIFSAPLVLLDVIITVFFGGNEELFMSTLDSFVDKFLEFVTENEDVLVSTSEKISELLGSVLQI